MRGIPERIALLGAVVLSLSFPVHVAGQVVPTQTGQELDNNFQIGSGGYNSVAGGVGGVNSQLYVNGQVTGLGGFRGHVPYLAPDQLRTNVPSARFSEFRSQSVGLQDVQRGQTYLTAPYYEPSRTAFNAGAISSGQTSPGSNIPKPVAPLNTLVSKLYIDATADYGSIMTAQTGQAISILPPLRSTEDRGPLVAPERLPADPFAVVSKPTAGALLGVFSARDRADLARELYEMQFRGSQGDGRLKTEAPGLVEGKVGAGAPDKKPPSRTVVPGPDVGNTGIPQANRDIYVDLLFRLREQRIGEAGLVEPVTGAPKKAAPAEGATEPDLPGRIPKPFVPFDQQTPSPGEIRIVELTKDKTLVLHGLAGVNPDLFNVHMGRAEKKLRAGKFYDAAGDFEVAITISPGNPLSRIGLALSLLGAGEPLSAGLYLRRAMELFPPIMETHLDVPAMLDGELAARRLAAVERRLKDKTEKTDPMLVLLAAYLNQNLGQAEAAKRYAEQLRTLADSDKLLAAYADYVLTGKRPQATTKPKT